MESSGSRGGLLTAGGTLSIVAGVFEIISGGLMVAFTSFGMTFGMLRFFDPSGVWTWREHSWAVVPIWPMVLGGLLVGLGIVAIEGGISAIQRKRFGLSLAGAICALPSGILVILGILAVIFVSLGKREFGAEKKEDGV
jgi:hypothetical protein